MDCIKYRKIISAYIDGEASSLETEEMLKHIAKCDDCNLILKNNTLLSEYITDSYSVSPAKIDFSRQIMHNISNLSDKKEKTSKRKNNLIILKTAAVAAAITLAITGVYYNNNTQVASKKQQDKITETLVMEHIDKSDTRNIPKKKLPQPTFVNYRR